MLCFEYLLLCALYYLACGINDKCSEVQCRKLITTVALLYRSSHLEVFLRKGVLKICTKFTGEHSCRSIISIKLLCNFIEIALQHGCSPVNLLHIFRTPFPKNTSRWLLLAIVSLSINLKKLNIFS